LILWERALLAIELMLQLIAGKARSHTRQQGREKNRLHVQQRFSRMPAP
jgi:hypothetical protein